MNSDNDSPKENAAGGDSPGGTNPDKSSADGYATAAAPGANVAAEAAPLEGPEEELARTKDRLLRMAADFDNYRKRSRRDIADAERRVQEGLLTALLPTFDNLERAAAHAESAPDTKSLVEGLGMIMRQFQDTLSDLGIERVASVGKAFDPAEHEAVQHIESEEVPPGAVVQELRPGYRWQGKLLRPALVVVAKAPARAAAAPEGA